MQASESSSEEVHPQSHGSAFTESRHWVSVYQGALHLHHLFNWRDSALRKINFMLLCNLPLSYCLSIKQVVFASLETNVPWDRLLSIYIKYTGKNGWKRTGEPLTCQVTGSWPHSVLPWVGRGGEYGPRGRGDSNLAINLLFCFIHHSFYAATLPATGWYLCHLHINERSKGHLH